jgi:hypothetical protein
MLGGSTIKSGGTQGTQNEKKKKTNAHEKRPMWCLRISFLFFLFLWQQNKTVKQIISQSTTTAADDNASAKPASLVRSLFSVSLRRPPMYIKALPFRPSFLPSPPLPDATYSLCLLCFLSMHKSPPPNTPLYPIQSNPITAAADPESCPGRWRSGSRPRPPPGGGGTGGRPAWRRGRCAARGCRRGSG